MKNKMGILGFGIVPESNSSVRKAPEIQTVIRTRKRGVDGIPLKIEKCYAVKIDIDGQLIEQRDFKKLFPSLYSKFNIKITDELKTNNKRQNLSRTVYFYFPNEMLERHEVKVIYRDSTDKMKRVIYDLSKDKESLA